jgi:excisionase family DNA binding protein
MENLSTLEEILTVEETAKYLKICRVNAYNLFHSEGFPCFKIGRSLRICRTDLLQWMKVNLSNRSN